LKIPTHTARRDGMMPTKGGEGRKGHSSATTKKVYPSPTKNRRPGEEKEKKHQKRKTCMKGDRKRKQDNFFSRKRSPATVQRYGGQKNNAEKEKRQGIHRLSGAKSSLCPAGLLRKERGKPDRRGSKECKRQKKSSPLGSERSATS